VGIINGRSSGMARRVRVDPRNLTMMLTNIIRNPRSIVRYAIQGK